ncbi:endonuclease domain-containing protein [Micromonospora sp. MA102]|uniref:endonuclease domain-containing protein n=1 Tax=Micromonospora sp. MA102 TaxID=2952755 RepID=UPI0034D970D1
MEPLRPQRRSKTAVAIRDGLGRRQCSMCKAWKPESDFGPSKLMSDRLDPRCRACVNRRNVELMYNLAPGEYDRLLENQGDACAICRRPFDDGRRPVVDHDHSCCPHKPKNACGRCVRAVLCGTCNSGLGMLREDARIIRRAITYLSASADNGAAP